MRKINFLSCVVIALCLMACGNQVVKPVSKKINGPLGEFFEIVDRDYNLKDGSLSVEFKRIAPGGLSLSDASTAAFTVEILEADDNVVSSESTNSAALKESLESIISLSEGESASITFHFNESGNATKFKVSSKLEAGGATVSSDVKPQSATRPKTEVVEDVPFESRSYPSECQYSWLSQRLVTESDLNGLSYDDLVILRNAIFAMHGYKFKRNELMRFFSQFDWYHGVSHDVYNQLNSIEKKNVKIIQQHEDYY